MHALRRRLGPERIAREGPGYRLCLEPGELDLERFELLAARGRSELARGDAEAAASSLREALELWRGPAYEDVRYEAFAQAEVARLEELRLAALEDRIEADLALGRHRDLVPELEALVSEHGEPRAALRAADARPLPERPAGRGARGVPAGAPRRCGTSSASSRGPRCRSCSRRSSGTIRRSPSSRPSCARDGTCRRRRRRSSAAAPSSPSWRRCCAAASRLVTLTGAGGIGKTRLALQVGHELAEAFADGVYFVDLSHLTDPELVPDAIAGVLGLATQRDEPPAAARARRSSAGARPCCCSTTSRWSTPRPRW